ncbi:sigma-54-dependent transcriptional regulator [Archangium lansingense]|uniref:Sigma-54 dependent transcriptional regulator n=1 Tax=Archangium lansingense TaxID=2995310 RepID=A0ABT3ZWI5_9BACT|nr:sigma-54 dependent transcriptional regulator [Archangium lansinium]MCY1073760.1 sigma-54 dependent transcriptional regulator [Archangium lansinium]
MGPEAIRALRGEQSRASFARQLGVTPLTVYRWELPEEAAQARRPRGRVMEALRQLAEGGQPALPPALRPANSLVRQELTHEEKARLNACLTLLQRADWRAAENTLLELLTSSELRTTGARALASVGLAYAYRWGYEDVRRAFAVLLPHLVEADAGLLPAESVEVYVHATAANLYASPDGRIFDAGKMNVHVARAEALLRPNHPLFAEVRCQLRLAQVAAAFYLGAPELLARQYGRLEEALAEVTDPSLRLMAMHGLAHEAAIRGEVSLATRRFRELAQAAARLGYGLLEARSLAFLAQHRLDEACEPEEALALVHRARGAFDGRLGRAFSFIFAARAEADALLRLGRFSEAEAVLEQGTTVTEELSWTPHHLVVQRARLLYLTGRYADLRQLAHQLSSYTGPIQQPLTRAYGCWVEALADWAEGHAQRSAEGFAAAHTRALELGGWPYLRRDSAVCEVGARAAAGQLQESRVALRRARAILEQFPSAWSTALLHRHEGWLLAREGRLREAREKLEASLATFTLAADAPEAALTRRTLAAVARAAGEPGAEAAYLHSEDELRRYGITPPPDFSAEIHPVQETPSPEAEPRLGAESLGVPFERLAVRGMGASLIQRELVAVLEGLFPGRNPRLEELDSQGRTTPLLGESTVPASEWVEFGDGCGRRLRVGVAGPLPADGRALISALARLAGFALEVAVLRGFVQAEPPLREPEAAPEVPGFIAASPTMNKLKTELAGLSGSRATVIVTGESGSGKEVVARALHRLSARADRPYVAFNCAAVPRELFEGQLFGYRRGAYTGAATDHPGVIRAAHGGTLFLDEIGELPLEVQPKLLRFLENGEIFPLGETRPAQVDVRVIAATHRDLGQLVREGRFREDLYYRLQVVPVRVPPLRERREDIIALARHFVNQLTPEGREPPQLGPDAMAALVAHSWPGNVRELRNVIERSLAFGSLPSVLGADRLRITG